MRGIEIIYPKHMGSQARIYSRKQNIFTLTYSPYCRSIRDAPNGTPTEAITTINVMAST